MTSKERWTSANMPDLSGTMAVVTGANSGLGYEVTRALAAHGARVIMACRDLEKGRRALARLQAELPGTITSPEIMELDLASLASVERFAGEISALSNQLDLLVNNAGLMHIPLRQTTEGFEMQFGTNHLGHFALTGRLLPLLLHSGPARVVTVSSFLHRQGKIDFDTFRIQDKARYNAGAAYAQSKLANVLFAYELQRKLKAAGAAAISLPAHPGYAATNLQLAGPQMSGSAIKTWLMQAANGLLAQSAARGALPLLYAATAPGVQGGEFYGPDGLLSMRGYPKKVASSQISHNTALAARLWEVSEELTGVKYSF